MDADGSEHEDALLAALAGALSALPPEGPRPVRLLMPGLEAHTGLRAARLHDLDLIASVGPLTFTQGFVTTAWSEPGHPEVFGHWQRYRAGVPVGLHGALHPQPGWERALNREPAVPQPAGASVLRVMSGFAIQPQGVRDPAFAQDAARLRPLDSALRLIVRGRCPNARLLAAVGELLATLPEAAVRRVQLVWPYAGDAAGAPALSRLARTLGCEITAPMAGLTVSGAESGVDHTTLTLPVPHSPAATDPDALTTHDVHVAHPDGRLGRWQVCGPDGRRWTLGAVVPAPAWSAGAAGLLDGLTAGTSVGLCPAGLHLRGTAEPSLGWLAERLPPHQDRLTVLVDGDADDLRDHEPLRGLLAASPPELRARLRLVMAHADGPAGPLQYLADVHGCPLTVATGASLTEAREDGDASLVQWSVVRPERVTGDGR
ncbi:hypothetical protein AB0D49_39380 [Streptomyces sp. NPDC048290]|uniref:hypothetical protein n=1 Tax=Streptomyces sp. NPDC048290 TaxID=3155811 RepID=UPI00341FF19E